MVRLARARYVLVGIGVVMLAMAAGGVLAAPRVAAQPQPTIVLSPLSGPCDATVEVTGKGFPPPSGPGETLRLYLVQPGTADVSMDILNPAFVQADGTFEELAPLHSKGCEAAALDSRAERPSGHLLIVASSSLEQSGAPPGQRIPNIMAVAQYAYTTTTPQPQPTMTITPSSGPCDATVEIAGRDFPADTGIHLDVGGGGAESTLGKLASLVTDSGGAFTLDVTLGSLGCQGAQWVEGLGAGPKQFVILANREEPVIVPGQAGMAGALYTYTTTVPRAPQALPSTGSGPEERSTPRVWLPWLAALAGMGLTLVVASLYRRRQRG